MSLLQSSLIYHSFKLVAKKRIPHPFEFPQRKCLTKPETTGTYRRKYYILFKRRQHRLFLSQSSLYAKHFREHLIMNSRIK